MTSDPSDHPGAHHGASGVFFNGAASDRWTWFCISVGRRDADMLWLSFASQSNIPASHAAGVSMLNSPHGRYSGTDYSNAIGIANSLPVKSPLLPALPGAVAATKLPSGYPWATAASWNKGITGLRGDLSNGTKFDSKFMDKSYSLTVPRFRVTACDSSGNPTYSITCRTDTGHTTELTSVEFYELPACINTGGTWASGFLEITPTTSVTLPSKTCSGTVYASATYNAAQSSTYGQNKGCMGCHDVHGSVVEATGTNGFKVECAAAIPPALRAILMLHSLSRSLAAPRDQSSGRRRYTAREYRDQAERCLHNLPYARKSGMRGSPSLQDQHRCCLCHICYAGKHQQRD